MIAQHSRHIPSIHEPTSARPPVPRRALAIFSGVTGVVTGIAMGAITTMWGLANAMPWSPPTLAGGFVTLGAAALLAGGMTTVGVAAGAAAWHALRWQWPHRVRVTHLPTLAGLGVAVPVALIIALAFLLTGGHDFPLFGTHVAVAAGGAFYTCVDCAVAVLSGDTLHRD